jgi:hypothetical protein
MKQRETVRMNRKSDQNETNINKRNQGKIEAE